jgi:hypothetical protein
MDAYILGRHEGDLPSHLLAQGEPGNRVRAIARLEGPDHDVFYALEAPDQQSLDSLVQAITVAGSNPASVLPACALIHCKGAIANVRGPSYLPPWPTYVFEWFDADTAAEAIQLAVDSLGEDAVAAATDGQGHILIELAGPDEDLIRATMALIRARLRFADDGLHAVTGDGMMHSQL